MRSLGSSTSTLGLAVALAGLAVATARAEPGRYRIDRERSELVAFVYRDGVAARFAHDHVISAPIFSGTVTYDPAAPLTLAVDVVADARALQADRPELVKKYKMDNDLDEEDRAEVEETLKGEDQLAVEQFPTIRFVSAGARPGTDGRLQLLGKLTLRGETRDVKVPVKLREDGDAVRGVAEFAIRQSEYGYEPYSAFFGALKVEDRVTLRIELLARPAPPEEEASGAEPAPTGTR